MLGASRGMGGKRRLQKQCPAKQTALGESEWELELELEIDGAKSNKSQMK